MEKNKIDILSCLYNYYEIDSDIRNGKIFLELIEDIQKELGVSFNFYYFASVVEHAKDIYKGVATINHLVFDDLYQRVILELLCRRNYYMKNFIKDLIKRLGYANSQDESEEIIDRYKKLPFINNIKFNGIDEYTIESTYGTYSFLLADRVLTDETIISYIRSGKHQNHCHSNATIMLNNNDDVYSITSLCPNYFIDWYYHSYSYFEDDDLVIDICSNMLIDKKQFDSLFETKEILFMRNDELKKLYYRKIKRIKSNLNHDDVLKCALYFQSLMLEDDPEEKKRVLEYNNSVLQGIK